MKLCYTTVGIIHNYFIFMLSSSQDILYIVLSLCLLWFTVFLCWLLYQAARVLRNANRMVENILQKLELIAEAMRFMRERVDRLTGSVSSITGMVANLVEKMVVGTIAKKMDERAKKRRAESKSVPE